MVDFCIPPNQEELGLGEGAWTYMPAGPLKSFFGTDHEWPIAH
jgi:hypothetical protein